MTWDGNLKYYQEKVDLISVKSMPRDKLFKTTKKKKWSEEIDILKWFHHEGRASEYSFLFLCSSSSPKTWDFVGRADTSSLVTALALVPSLWFAENRSIEPPWLRHAPWCCIRGSSTSRRSWRFQISTCGQGTSISWLGCHLNGRRLPSSHLEHALLQG